LNQSQWKPLIWAFLHALLLLSIFSPLALLTIFLMMIPIVVLFVQLSLPKFAAYYAAGLVLLLLILHGVSVIPIAVSLFYLPTSVVMGLLYRRRTPARTVLTSGTVIMLAQLLLTLLIITLMGYNVMNELNQFMQESLSALPESMRGYITEEARQQVVHLVVRLLPLYFICYSVFVVSLTHTLARRVLNRNKLQIPGLRPIREWMLPKSLVWYFMVALILDFFIPDDINSILTMILWNLIPLLTIAFSIQAIAFLFYVAYHRGMSRALPVAGIAAVIIFPFMQYIFSVLGVLDVAFGIRERIRRTK
jgi:uncharacterized protein YybS (DUF2232 family)